MPPALAVKRFDMTWWPKSSVARLVLGVAMTGAVAALILKLLERVRAGRGGEQYMAMSGYIWSPIPVLIFMVLALVILVGGGFLRWIWERNEERSFMDAMRHRMALRRKQRDARGDHS